MIPWLTVHPNTRLGTRIKTILSGRTTKPQFAIKHLKRLGNVSQALHRAGSSTHVCRGLFWSRGFQQPGASGKVRGTRGG